MRHRDDSALKVFISYRNKDHAHLVPRIGKILTDHGINVIYDKNIIREQDQELSKTIPVTSGVNLKLLIALRSCHAVITLTPEESADPHAFLRRWQDWADLLAQALTDVSIRGGRGVPPDALAGALYDLPIIWYLVIYDVDIRKRLTESWQEWEARVSDVMGLTLIPIQISDDIDIGAYLRDDVLPRLMLAPRQRRKPPPKQEYLWLFTAARLVQEAAVTTERVAAAVTLPYRAARGAAAAARARITELRSRGRA